MTGLRPIEISGVCPMVRMYQRQIVRMIVTDITLVPLAHKWDSSRLVRYPFYAGGGVNPKQMSPGRDLFHET